jgi:trehalose 6-phosphate phosphatase
MTIAEEMHRAAPLKDFGALAPLIDSSSHIALFLDFDGTLADIVPVPDDAELDGGIRKTLESLIAREDFTVSIVSGRAAADLRRRVGLKDLIYVGNHGFEIESDEIRFREPDAEALRGELRCLALQLKLALSDTDGLEIEDKSLTLSVHFRRVTEDLQDWVRNVTRGTVARYPAFSLREGNMVVEVLPRIDWNKGRAVKWIVRQLPPTSSLAIYIGDDLTDEDAFLALSEGITIRVGGFSDTAAQYLLPDVSAVGLFLKWLDHAKQHAPRANSQRVGT